MSFPLNRREFLQTTAACTAAAAVMADNSPARPPSPGPLVLNDDGHVFLMSSDDLTAADLERYLQSYCRPGVDAIAYCVGDMSWPTFYPSKVGVHYKAVPPENNLRSIRIHRNVENLESEPGGYFGAAISGIQKLGKQCLASFRMNDAHFTTLDNPNVSEFWKHQSKRTLGPVYGYYGGCLNYEFEEVRQHIYERITEFAALYPQIDGIELDCMRSPFFFPPDKGEADAPLFTDLVKRIRSALTDQAKRLNRPEYLLTINVPLTPQLALTSGLDVVTWDRERLFHIISTGTYNATMNHPLDQWKQVLDNTPVFAYVGVGPNDGQYFGLEEYRAAAANAFGGGADGVYLFNYPCLFELAMQRSSDVAEVPMRLPDLRTSGQRDFSQVARALDEIGDPGLLRGKRRHYLFYSMREPRYRHYDPDQASLDRGVKESQMTARFHCFDDIRTEKDAVLTFKLENTARSERFVLSLNRQPIADDQITLRYASNGRDTRMHTITLGPYLEYEITLKPAQLRRGVNELTLSASKLRPDLDQKIHLLELELTVNGT